MTAPPSDEEMMHVAAAALIRYASNAEVKAAVDRYAPTLNETYQFLEKLTLTAPWLFDAEGRLIPRQSIGEISRQN